jgi:hypothetical protein
MEIFRYNAPPTYWGEQNKIYYQCGSAHNITVECSTESNMPSTFSARIHVDTSFKPIEFVAPGKKVIALPEGCGWIRLSLKSHSIGQMVLCKVKVGI